MEPYVDSETGLPVLCPACHKEVSWDGQQWQCSFCRYVGEDAIWPEPLKAPVVPVENHPQRPECHIVLDLTSLEAAFVQRLARTWQCTSQEAIIRLVKKETDKVFRPQ